ncbi:MAG: citrate/2-methylcitrate synthase, partial [Acidimicrobiales bacterium]
EGANSHMAESGLTATEAAARLGVKRQTLYAYVSRGVLPRRVAEDGRTSLFDPGDVERLRLGRRPETDGELHTQITTALTRVDDQNLWIRGQDLVAMVSGGATFADVVDLLWASPAGETWRAPVWDGAGHASGTKGSASELSPIDELRVIVALSSSADPLRHDLSSKSVRAVGRRLIPALARGLHPPSDRAAGALGELPHSLPLSLWTRLAAREPDDKKLAALDTAMALLVDHGLASSTFAARIAASVRADPYSVVTSGLGAFGGPLHGSASAGVHDLLTETERSGSATEAAGVVRRRMGGYPGFGHTVYKLQDPRYGALMATLIDAFGDDPRLVSVYRVRDVIGERTDAIPNIDLAIGALTYLAEMSPDSGEVIFAVARTAGWLAHAMEEYDEKPLRFRPKAKYAGPSPR